MVGVTIRSGGKGGSTKVNKASAKKLNAYLNKKYGKGKGNFEKNLLKRYAQGDSNDMMGAIGLGGKTAARLMKRGAKVRKIVSGGTSSKGGGRKAWTMTPARKAYYASKKKRKK